MDPHVENDEEPMEDVHVPWRMCAEAQRLRMLMSIALGLWLGGPAVGLLIRARAGEIGFLLLSLFGIVGVGGFIWWCVLAFQYWSGWRSFRGTGT